jgi:hypothetical protein
MADKLKITVGAANDFRDAVPDGNAGAAFSELIGLLRDG